jgi:hypothetical protein
MFKSCNNKNKNRIIMQIIKIMINPYLNQKKKTFWLAFNNNYKNLKDKINKMTKINIIIKILKYKIYKNANKY